jgi:hypothetical protein
VLQDLALSVFHSSTLTFSSTPTIKIVENHLGRAFVKQSREIIINIPRGAPAIGPAGPTPGASTVLDEDAPSQGWCSTHGARDRGRI